MSLGDFERFLRNFQDHEQDHTISGRTVSGLENFAKRSESANSELFSASSMMLEEKKSLLEGTHGDPHRILGLHEGGACIRLFRPGAFEVWLELSGTLVKMQPHEGLFEYRLKKSIGPLDYKIFHTDGTLAHDPYVFTPTLGDTDLYLFGTSCHYEVFHVLGANVRMHMGVAGVAFAVWAPSARRVSVVGDFNHWDGRVNPMRACGHSGVWELFVPGLAEGAFYKFEILTNAGQLLVKADPYAKASELRPNTASRVFNPYTYVWNDAQWMQERKIKKERPINVYEVHLGSWKRADGGFLSYRDLGPQLAAYCTDMGFTHVELMPVMEHPFDLSWGYQVTGFYAVTSRYGNARDFQFFVDTLHQSGIGVIVDWVPAHFPTDDFALARFDGTALYEHDDPRQGFHPHWNTLIFNYGRKEVANFLIGSALYWLSCMHVDGLRVDAVASMLYLDYGRDEGQWIPNAYGGKENLDAIEFLKHLNAVVHERNPGILMIAEESTAFCGVTHPLTLGGLGFDMKWNMGWMNDTLAYFSKDPIYRRHHQDMLTFGQLYAYSERFQLVLSHDEVVHGKKSLLAKMPGDVWQQFANARLLYSYMICQPGKKLLFMGGELGQWDEWRSDESIQWHLLDYVPHRALFEMVKALNHYYKVQEALWERDFDHTGFEWVNFSDRDNSVIAYVRKSTHKKVLCVHNFTPNYIPSYFLGGIGHAREVFNSDAECFGGSGKVTGVPQQHSDGISIVLAPLATSIFEL